MPLDVNDAASIARWREALVPGLLVLYSIPSVKHGEKFMDETPAICHVLKDRPPARVIYLSTTGVYGEVPTGMSKPPQRQRRNASFFVQKQNGQ